MANVLIVDDDRLISEAIAAIVRRHGHTPAEAATLQAGLREAREKDYDVIFLDVRLPDGDGLSALPDLRALPSNPEIIIITGFGDPDGAELAIRNGAWDYIEKPSSVQEMTLPLLRALQYREERRAKAPINLKREGIIGKCPALLGAVDLVAQAAGNDVNVLIVGETGTGKELFAWAIHENSPRAHRNFVIVDCAALPETLVESVLFGHTKGAFTGADRHQEGLIKQADGGTLFLDEVGELPLSIQRSFLRVLQEHRFRPVGSSDEVKSDFRLVAATNRDLETMVRRGEFREDLLFRLRTIVIPLPPLRDCREDIKELTLFYMRKLSSRFKLEEKGFSPEFWDILEKYSWPGNVRELIQALEHALIAAKHEPILYSMHLPSHIRAEVAKRTLRKQQARPEEPAGSLRPEPGAELKTLKEVRDAAADEAEKIYLQELLARTGGRIKTACEISGLSRSRLYTLFKKHNIPPRL